MKWARDSEEIQATFIDQNRNNYTDIKYLSFLGVVLHQNCEFVIIVDL